MSPLSRLGRRHKHRNRVASQAERRRWLSAGFEQLEDRRVMAISTVFAAGVLTFTGDVPAGTNDTVILQSTATPGTVVYDDGGGLGSTTLGGVNQVIFNAGGGQNKMILINDASTTFRPFAGAAFGIQFNVTDDADADELRIAGGTAASILSGNYTVSGPTSGTITYTTATQPINISFNGLNSSGATPDVVNDVTIQGGSFTTNTSTGGENVTVKVGPVLAPVQSFVQGPVFVDGGDREDHGALVSGANTNGWLFMQQALNFVYTSKVTAFGNAPVKNVLVVGTTAGSQARAAFDSAANLAVPGGLTRDYVTGASLSAANFANYDLIYVPSDDNDVVGGISNADLTILTARKADIQAFIRAGGGLMAMTEGAVAPASLQFSWLELPLPFTITSFGGLGISQPLRKTTEAIAAGFTISNAALSLGVPYHNVFTGPTGFNGLDIFVLDTGPNGVVDGFAPAGDDRAVTLGQGAINQALGGGPTTQIGGNAMTLVNLGNKLNLNLNTLGGTDTIVVDGSTLTLDGLLAPLTINGGGNGDSLSITDSADPTGDAVSITSLATTGLAAFPITYSGVAALSVQATQGADTLTLDFSAAGPTSATVFGGAGGDTFTGPTGYVRPSTTIQISVHGDIAAKTTVPVNPGTDAPLSSPDKLFLDMATTASGPAVTPLVIVDSNSGKAIGGNTKLFTFTGMDDFDLFDDGHLTNANNGDLYLRATEGNDMINISGLVNNGIGLRVNNTAYGDFAPTGKIVVFGRAGRDYITNNGLNASTRLELYGNEGDDVIAGGPGNDLIIGGEGNDRLSGGYGGVDEIWGDVFNPVVPTNVNLDIMLFPADPAAIAIRKAQSAQSTFNSAGGAATVADGNDSISTAGYGGADRLYGQGGNDNLGGGTGNDYENGGNGADFLAGSDGNDRLYGGAGNDGLAGDAGNDLAVGGTADDSLAGGAGDDVLIGDAGVDVISGSSGNDLMVGATVANDASTAWGDANDLAMTTLNGNWTASPDPSGAVPGTLAVTDDGQADNLSGDLGADYYYNDAALLDILTGLLAVELDKKKF